jgi:hypothetical protein
MKYPQLFDACEAISARAQKMFLRSRTGELACLVLAGALGEASSTFWHKSAILISFVLFLGALLLRISGLGDRAEKLWYDARAACESIKSASWKYAVHLPPFNTSNEDSRDQLSKLLVGIIVLLPKLDIPAKTETRSVVTQEMELIRNSTEPERAREYKSSRLNDQITWYSNKAEWNRRRAKKWHWILVLVESCAVILGLLRLLSFFNVNWIGILAAASAALAAWQQTKNYSSLSESYAVTSHELSLVADSLETTINSEGWIKAVTDAETAFSREHTLWLARRGAKPIESSEISNS